MEARSRFELRDSRGRDELGEVFRASERTTGRAAAVKLFDAWALESATGRSAYAASLQELRRLMAARTPPVAAFHIGSEEGWVASRWIDGTPLDELLETRATLPLDEAASIVCGLLDALDELHSSGRAHGGLSPRKVLLLDGVHPGGVVVTDPFQYQLYAVDNPLRTSRDEPTRFLGLPQYFSPEQAHGQAPDVRSDVYVVGLILYQLVTGKTPFLARTASTTLKRQIYEKPLPTRYAKPGLKIPSDAEEILNTALSKDPVDRFQTAHAFRRAVATLRAEHDEAAERSAAPMGISPVGVLIGNEPPSDVSAILDPLRDGDDDALIVPLDDIARSELDLDALASTSASGASARTTEALDEHDEASRQSQGDDDRSPDASNDATASGTLLLSADAVAAAVAASAAASKEEADDPAPDAAASTASDPPDEAPDDASAATGDTDRDDDDSDSAAMSDGAPSAEGGTMLMSVDAVLAATAAADETSASDSGPQDTPTSRREKRRSKRSKKARAAESRSAQPQGGDAPASEGRSASSRDASPEPAPPAEKDSDVKAVSPPPPVEEERPRGGRRGEADSPESDDELGWFARGEDSQAIHSLATDMAIAVDDVGQHNRRFIIGVTLLILLAVLGIAYLARPSSAPAPPTVTAPDAAPSQAAPLAAAAPEVDTGAIPEPEVDDEVEAAPTGDEEEAVEADEFGDPWADAEDGSLPEPEADPGAAEAEVDEVQAPPSTTPTSPSTSTPPRPTPATPTRQTERPSPASERPVSASADREAARQRARQTLTSAQAALDSRDFGEARRLFQQVIALDDSIASAHAGLGDVEFQDQNYPQAARHHRTATRLASRNAEYHRKLGMDYFRLENFSAALTAFERAVELGDSGSARHVELVRARLGSAD